MLATQGDRHLAVSGFEDPSAITVNGNPVFVAQCLSSVEQTFGH